LLNKPQNMEKVMNKKLINGLIKKTYKHGKT